MFVIWSRNPDDMKSVIIQHRAFSIYGIHITVSAKCTIFRTRYKLQHKGKEQSETNTLIKTNKGILKNHAKNTLLF